MKFIRAKLREVSELTKSDKAISETLAEKTERRKRIFAEMHEEFGIKGSGNEQAT
jgi:hypothetical protein